MEDISKSLKEVEGRLNEENLSSQRLQAEKIVLEESVVEKEQLVSELQLSHKELKKKLRCELDALQANYDRRILEESEFRQKKLSQLTSAEEASRNRLLQRKDSELAKLNDTCDSLQGELDSASGKMTEADEVLAKQKKEIVNLQQKLKETEEQMDKQVHNMEGLNKDLRHKIDSLQNDLVSLEEQVKQGNLELEKQKLILEKNHKEKNNSLTEQLSSLKNINDQQSKEIYEVQEQRNKFEKNWKAIDEKWQNIIDYLEKLIIENSQSDINFDDKKESIHIEVRKLIDNKKEEFCQLENKHLSTLEEASNMKDKASNLSKHVKKLELQMTDLRENKVEIGGKLDSEKQEKSILTSTITDLRKEFDEEKSRASLEAKKAYDDLEKSLLNIPSLPSDRNFDFKSLIEFLSHEREELKKKLLEEITNNEDLKTQLREIRKEREQIEKSCNDLIAKLEEAEKQLRLAREELSSAKQGEGNVSLENVPNSFDEAIEECKKELHDEYMSKLKEKSEERDKFWEEKMSKCVKEKAEEMQKKMDYLAQQWTKEKKELERLTQVATAAFKTGTNSVDNLKKQLNSHKKHMEELRQQHIKEIGELQAKLDMKQRRNRGLKMAGSLEDSAEYEYLKNILFQYMVGKETQTLSKVLGALVKFTNEQQDVISEYEERKQSIENNEKTTDEILDS